LTFIFKIVKLKQKSRRLKMPEEKSALKEIWPYLSPLQKASLGIYVPIDPDPKITCHKCKTTFKVKTEHEHFGSLAFIGKRNGKYTPLNRVYLCLKCAAIIPRNLWLPSKNQQGKDIVIEFSIRTGGVYDEENPERMEFEDFCFATDTLQKYFPEIWQEFLNPENEQTFYK